MWLPGEQVMGVTYKGTVNGVSQVAVKATLRFQDKGLRENWVSWGVGVSWRKGSERIWDGDKDASKHKIYRVSDRMWVECDGRCRLGKLTWDCASCCRPGLEVYCTEK